MDLVAIREALADAISSGVGQVVNVYPYMPNDPAWPCIVVTPSDPYLSPHQSYDLEQQLVRIDYDVLIGGTGRPEDAMRLLDQMLSLDSDASVIDCIEAASGNPGENTALGGLVENMVCREVSILNPGEPNAQVFAASIQVSVLARR